MNKQYNIDRLNTVSWRLKANTRTWNNAEIMSVV
jgi:hypothetical protein